MKKISISKVGMGFIVELGDTTWSVDSDNIKDALAQAERMWIEANSHKDIAQPQE